MVDDRSNQPVSRVSTPASHVLPSTVDRNTRGFLGVRKIVDVGNRASWNGSSERIMNVLQVRS
jgi:hypothetical protein